MTTADQLTGIEGLISVSEIQRELRQRRRTYLEKSVPFSHESRLLGDGWEIVRRNKNSVRMRRLKPIGRAFEDSVWCMLGLMGFHDLNSGYEFKIPVSTSGADVPPKQIDVLAVDAETALVVECKASTTLRSRSLQKDLNETRALQEPIRRAIHNHFKDRPRVCFVYATRNINWSKPDLQRAQDHQIRILFDRHIDYFRKLVDIIGPAARHQLQAHLLPGTTVKGLNAKVPALRGTFGQKRFYQFAIEPDRLLKLAYVSHRTKIDAQAVGTYQRLLRKKRLKDIATHINEHGGIFPTNVVVNFRDAKLQFDQSGPIGDDPTVLGTLQLPNKYKSAWVIDGQHRLYGFALSKMASKGRIPVLAFEDLDPIEEAELFVDINSKQVKVPRSLLVELEPHLGASSDDPRTQFNRFLAQLAGELSDSELSPLSGRVVTDWDTNRSNKPLTLPEMVSGVRGSQIVGSVRNGTWVPGHLYLRDWETSLPRVKSTIEKFLQLFAEGAEEHWLSDRQSGGFLCTNLGFAALMRVFNTVLEFEKVTLGIPDYLSLSPDAIVGCVSERVQPIINWFSETDDAKLDRFRGRYGGGAPIAYAFDLMQIINEEFKNFDPPGLTEHIQSSSKENIAHAQKLLTETEDAIRGLTLKVLKDKYGHEDEAWWREGVPQSVRGPAAQRAEMDAHGGRPHQFLGLLDFKSIAELSKNWLDFERYWTLDRKLRSKKDRLGWMERLSNIRNRAFHSGRGRVSPDEIAFLEETAKQVTHNWKQLSRVPPR